METLTTDYKFCHYCSLEALYGIVSNRELWLTSLDSTNDAKELKVGADIFAQALQQMIDDVRNILIRDYLVQVANPDVHSEGYRRCNKRIAFFAAAFSSQYDSLSHWERYGNNCRGICLQFDFKQYYNYLEDNGVHFPFNDFICIDYIRYNISSQVEFVESLLVNKLSELRKRNLPSDALMLKMAYPIWEKQARLFCKHDSFASEHELRVVYEDGAAELGRDVLRTLAQNNADTMLFKNRLKSYEEIIEQLQIMQKNKKFSLINNSIRGHYSLNLSPFWSSKFIPQIVLGPQCTQNITELKAFLKNNGLSQTKINISSIPIR